MTAGSDGEARRGGLAVLHLAAAAVALGGLLFLLGRSLVSVADEGPGRVVARMHADTDTLLLVVLEGVVPQDLEELAVSSSRLPNFARLARESTWFDRHWAQCNGTNGAFATLLSGLLPSAHGLGSVHRLGRERLSGEVTLLSEDLAAAGWTALASVATPTLSAEFSGFDQGWDAFASPTLSAGEVERDARAVVDALLAELDARVGTSAPLFLLCELRDALEPHAPPVALEAAALRRHLGTFRDAMPAVAAALDAGDADCVARVHELLDRRRGDHAWDALQRAQREAELVHLDRELGRLLERLEGEGRLERALVVVTGNLGADALAGGEEFGPFPPERLHVPLLVRLPGGSRGRPVQRLTSASDLRPTLLDALGLAGPEADGTSLLPLISGSSEDAAAPHACVLVEDRLLGEAAAVDDFWFVRSRPGTTAVPLDASRAQLAERDVPPVPRDSLERTRRTVQLAAREPELEVVLSPGRPVGYELELTTTEGEWLEGEVVGDGARFVGRTGAASDGFGKPRAAARAALSVAEEDPGPAVLRLSADRATPALRARIACDSGELDEALVRFGDRTLAHLALPRLADPRAAEWPEDREPLVDVAHDSGLWSTVRVGGAPGRRVELLLASVPASDATLSIERSGGFETQRIAGRDDCLWVTGVTPLQVRVQSVPGTELGLAVALESEQVAVRDMRRDGRCFADPGELLVALPSWLPGVHEHLERALAPAQRAAEPGALWLGRARCGRFASPGTVPAPGVRAALSRAGELE